MAASMRHSRLCGQGSRPRIYSGCPRPVRPLRARHAPSRRPAVSVKAFFNFLTPPTSSTPKTDPRALELSDELVGVCAASGSPDAKRERVEALVSELSRYSVKAPLRSPLLWGTYEVLYCSKPEAVGGPLKKGAGPVLFPGQVATQTLVEPNSLVNEVRFATLGFIPGFSRQYGEIEPLSGDTFLLSISRGELNTGLGTTERAFEIQRKIQIVYLDDSLRIARFLPDASLADQEAAEAGSDGEEDIVFVFRRLAAEGDGEEEAEEAAEEAEEEAKPLPALLLPFGGTRKTEGLATVAERQVRRQLQAEGSAEEEEPEPQPQRSFFGFGSRRVQMEAVEEEEEEEEETPAQRRARERREALEKRQAEAQARKQAAAEAKAAQQREEQQRRSAEEVRAAKEREVEERRKAAEEAKAAKAREAEEKRKAAEEARARAEQEKAARAERQAAIKELLAELTEAVREQQAEAKEAAALVKQLQRDGAPVLKAGAAARQEVEEAEAEVAQVVEALTAAAEERKAAEAALRQAQQVLKEAEAEFRKKQLAAAPVGRG